ncbi:hypothetical protein FG386_001029 [Cryptosporidium ryanae]|uniref:uncharacterized protein n=1 Tax=Cryptosporidium ryanae TaxID=515981 RepID=UPI00351A8275|nr:hypothetical protein FG386_001029 [Cryptosporidium ryanae]
MENGDKYIQRVGVKEGRVSRTQYLFFQVYNNTKRCCWNISIPRECISLSRILLEYPYSYFLPLLSCFQCIFTILVCHIISFSLKHLPYHKLFIPFTYFLTINSPEKYIYMFGLILSWLFFVSSTPMLYHLLFYHLPQPLEVWVTPRYSKLGDSVNKEGEAFLTRSNFVNETFTHGGNIQQIKTLNDNSLGNPKEAIINVIDVCNDNNLTGVSSTEKNIKSVDQSHNNTMNGASRRQERCIVDEYTLDDKGNYFEEYEPGNINTKEVIRVKQGVFHRLIATWTLRLTFLSLSIGIFFGFFAIIFPFGFNFKKLLHYDQTAIGGNINGRLLGAATVSGSGINGIGVGSATPSGVSSVGGSIISSTAVGVGFGGTNIHVPGGIRGSSGADNAGGGSNNGLGGIGVGGAGAGGILNTNLTLFVYKYLALLLKISPSSIFVFFTFIHALLISIYVYIYRRPVISRLSRTLKIGCSISLVSIVFIRLILKLASPLFYVSKTRSSRLFNDNYPNLNSFLADFNIKLKSNNLFYFKMAITSDFQYLFLFIIMVFVSTYSLDIHQLHLSSINAFKSNEDSDTYSSLIKRGEFPLNNEEKDSLQY